MESISKTFSVVVPVYQNRANLEKTFQRLRDLSALIPGFRLELVFVDDGSTDGSRELLQQLAAQHPSLLRAVLLTRNFGQSPAIQAGLRNVTGDCVGIISCDLQEPCEQFAEMVGQWSNGHKFILGERVERSENATHKAASSIYWRLVRRFAFPDFPALGYDFCVLDRQIAEEINSINEKNTSIFVLIFWLGHKPVRVPIRRSLRTEGRSQWNLRKKVAFTIDTLIGFTYLPARLISFVGFGTAVLSIVYLGFILVRWRMLRAAPPGWMTVVGLVTVLGSLNLFAFGILSEYLLRILDEARKRPPFIVERVVNPASGTQ